MGKRAPLVVVLAVGLTRELLLHMPRLRALAERGRLVTLRPPLPAVTCTSQSTILTGLLPRDHGIVGNGWYFRDLSEVWLWRQSNRLVRGQRLWQAARKRWPGFRTAKLFWWFNMYADVELSVTVRPHYLADGRKLPGIYTNPPRLEAELEQRLGGFPLFQFWGPAAGLASSEWIARSARAVFDAERPDLTLVYLPHLDYELQRCGPRGTGAEREAAALDAVAADLLDHVIERGARVAVVSEYGIERVQRPVHPNRALRAAGLLAVRQSLCVGELLDAGASRAFCVSDHQVGQVYVRDPADLPAARRVLEELPGVERVLDREAQRSVGIDHPRAGELVIVAARGAWFTYYYWQDDADAPDFARTVDIHNKPGYDPVELFLAPGVGTKLRLARKVAQKKLGFRYVMDVIPLDATLVHGSHGRAPSDRDVGPLLILDRPDASGTGADHREMTDVKSLLLRVLAECGEG